MKLELDGIILSEDENVEVERTVPENDECRVILLQVLKQAIEDYRHFYNKTKPEYKELWLSAEAFLFNDEYLIDWGDQQINLPFICEVLNLDILWVRRKIIERMRVKMQKNGIILKEFY